jgi:alkylation response protein AidB-like acyl-CoA dehydrogenase
LRSIEEYAVESSINKVWCSEALDYVVDEMVQIYGGAGYSADYPAEKLTAIRASTAFLKARTKSIAC